MVGLDDNHLAAARRAIASERDRSQQEREAFEAFSERVEGLQAEPAQPPTPGPIARNKRQRPTGDPLEAVWSAIGTP